MMLFIAATTSSILLLAPRTSSALEGSPAIGLGSGVSIFVACKRVAHRSHGERAWGEGVRK